MKEFEGIVIRSTSFREQDCMINVISQEGLKSFLAKGVLKLESKNASSVALYTRSRFHLFNGKEGVFLRQGVVLDSYSNLKNDFGSLAVLDFMGEVTTKLVQGEDGGDIYPMFARLLELLDSRFDRLTACLIYLCNVLKKTGYGLTVDKCIKCGHTTDITAVSYKDGGFICRDCFATSSGVKYPPRKLKIIRYCFKVEAEQVGTIQFEKDECLDLLNQLVNFVNDKIQVQIKSMNLLKII